MKKNNVVLLIFVLSLLSPNLAGNWQTSLRNLYAHKHFKPAVGLGSLALGGYLWYRYANTAKKHVKIAIQHDEIKPIYAITPMIEDYGIVPVNKNKETAVQTEEPEIITTKDVGVQTEKQIIQRDYPEFIRQTTTINVHFKINDETAMSFKDCVLTKDALKKLKTSTSCNTLKLDKKSISFKNLDTQNTSTNRALLFPKEDILKIHTEKLDPFKKSDKINVSVLDEKNIIFYI